MIKLKHNDGVSDLDPSWIDEWFSDRLKRIRAYWDLGDLQRTQQEVALLDYALKNERLPEKP